MGWRRRDTVTVFAAFVLPIVSALIALSTYYTASLGELNTIELSYTGWAITGLIISAYKVYLLAGDQRAVILLKRGWRERLGGAWMLANSTAFLFAFLMWAIVGLIAGQLPSAPSTESPVQGIPPVWLTGGAFMMVEGVFMGIMVFGLLCRRRLAE